MPVSGPNDRIDKIKARTVGTEALKTTAEGNKMRAAQRGRRWVEEWKDASGGKTIWEGKYLAIQLLERGCATHLCCSVCKCVCSQK